jgi:hypothetical protein
MSLGMEKYFDVKWIVDNNEIACATLNSNKKDFSGRVYTEDVKKFLLQSIKANPCYPSAGEVDHIHASRELGRRSYARIRFDYLPNTVPPVFVVTSSSMQRVFACQSKWRQKR